MSVTAPDGFVAAGIPSGIKESGDPDLALVATVDGAPVNAAGVFTTNKMAAAPVTVSQGALRTSAGRAAAVVLNSGNANAGTGERGIEDAEAMCVAVAAELGADPHHVLVCSTGLIGFELPMEVILDAVPRLVAGRAPGGGHDAAEAIRTTDTLRKEEVVRSAGFTVGAMAKGAAMLAPNMATMLAVLTTDAEVDPATLREVLADAVEQSFNRITIDGATSTNDTVLILANGRAGAPDPLLFRNAVTSVCTSLARQMVEDAEGATSTVRVRVEGAHDDAEAAIGARKVAESQLVKCSWYGRDPYWGRVASELGSAGIHFDQRLLAVSYGSIVVAERGVSVAHDTDALADYLASGRIEINAHLGLGSGEASILSADLTHAYVDENMGTS